MKEIIKKLFTFLCVIILIFSFSACDELNNLEENSFYGESDSLNQEQSIGDSLQSSSEDVLDDTEDPLPLIGNNNEDLENAEIMDEDFVIAPQFPKSYKNFNSCEEIKDYYDKSEFIHGNSEESYNASYFFLKTGDYFGGPLHRRRFYIYSESFNDESNYSNIKNGILHFSIGFLDNDLGYIDGGDWPEITIDGGGRISFYILFTALPFNYTGGQFNLKRTPDNNYSDRNIIYIYYEDKIVSYLEYDTKLDISLEYFVEFINQWGQLLTRG